MKPIQFEQLNDTNIIREILREKGEKMRDVLVDCLVGFLQRMDEQNWNIKTREG